MEKTNDFSNWKPSQDKDASPKSIDAACKMVTFCLFRASDLPKGQSLYGMQFNVKAALYDLYKDRPGKPLPSQKEVSYLWDLINFNKAPRNEGDKYAPWVDEIDYKENKKILNDLFDCKFFESIRLEKAGSAKESAANKALEAEKQKNADLEKRLALLEKMINGEAVKKAS